MFFAPTLSHRTAILPSTGLPAYLLTSTMKNMETFEQTSNQSQFEPNELADKKAKEAANKSSQRIYKTKKTILGFLDMKIGNLDTITSK